MLGEPGVLAPGVDGARGAARPAAAWGLGYRRGCEKYRGESDAMPAFHVMVLS
jgi:hypothetical protein